MRLRTLVPALAVAAGFAGAFPGTAHAESGVAGCAGLPTVPAAYVCIVSLTPENAVPRPGGTTIPVTVPPVCYVAGCTTPTTVDVPVPGAEPGSGAVAVLWYQGTTIPIVVGEIPSLGELPSIPSVPSVGDPTSYVPWHELDYVFYLQEWAMGVAAPVQQTVDEHLLWLQGTDPKGIVREPGTYIEDRLPCLSSCPLS